MQTQRGHRRTSSLPRPYEGSGSGESEGDCDDRRTSEELSFCCKIAVQKKDVSLNSHIEIPDLCHSPTNKRRSISVFNFLEDIIPQREVSSQSNEPNMSSNKVKRILRHRHISSTSSIDSFETEDYRSMVLREIINTEQKYINSLQTLLSIYLPALETIMAPTDIRLLFPCQLEPLITMHNDLLSRLQERVDGISRWHGIVGDVFGRLCSDKQGEFIALYSAYMNEFKIAMQTLVKYEHTSPLFCQISKTCSKLETCDGLSLAAYLLTPVQRLPRYELLLKQLLKHTSEDHPDSYYIEAALNTLHSDLLLLDRSIQSCQFACTVGRMKDESHKRPNRRYNRRQRHQSSRMSRIRRHLSHANIHDFSPNNSPQMTARSYSRPGSLLTKSRSFACSEHSLLEKMEEECEKRSSSVLSRPLASSRGISFSEVLLHDRDDTVKIKKDLEEYEEEDEEEERGIQTPNMSRSHSPSVTSHESIAQRGSVYSSNSSTSGFDSLTGATEDYFIDGEGCDNKTLRPLQPLASICSDDSGFKDGKENSPISTPVTSSSPRKNSSLSTALRVIRKASKELGNSPLTRQKRAVSTGNVNRLSISDPMDFRHIQHGFSSRPISTVI